jgi:hypothetical protein
MPADGDAGALGSRPYPSPTCCTSTIVKVRAAIRQPSPPWRNLSS